MAAVPQPCPILAASPEPPAIMDAMPVFLAVMNFVLEAIKALPSQLRLVSSVTDPLLMSVQAAGIPVASAPSSLSASALSSLVISEIFPPSAALTLMASQLQSFQPMSLFQSMSPLQSSFKPQSSVLCCQPVYSLPVLELPVCFDTTIEIVN
ncbi:Low-density lipoprotein receptor-related protein 2 [Labeo rohita]|uniref:Low-density lipoprotein receptor-related protein 2 n=1 Tax=Labeo rohita TaxID=84645 RepID=A0ABQ8LBI2_LABRO|nr:Low-density lipoprotein receptor-related protein 2 [Labeo rohita]